MVELGEGPLPGGGGHAPVPASTRAALHRVAAHVLGRRRFAVSGHFGLRASPGGIATPAFGDGPEVLRVAGTHLVREQGGTVSHLLLPGATLREAARFAEADLDAPYDFGDDAPPVGDPDAAIELDAAVLRGLAAWFGLAWLVLDRILVITEAVEPPSTVQLWPEHFDAGTTVALGPATRVNLGFSAGDGTVPEPYVYVGPWGDERPGDAAYWNAPFGAVLTSSSVPAADPAAACEAFFRRGLALLAG